MGGFVYDLGGFDVRSTISLPGLHAGPPRSPVAAIHVDIANGSVPRGTAVFRWPGRYGLTLETLGDEWVFSSKRFGAAVIAANGRSVRFFPDAAASSDWPDVLVRRILPRLAHWHGRIALHAAAISDGRTAIMLLGPSGVGKSTLAAAMRHTGPWRVLGDDISLIDGEATPPIALPTNAGLCLWLDSLSAFVGTVAACRTVAGHDRKRWLDDSVAVATCAYPAASIILLAPRQTGCDVQDTSLSRVVPKDAAMYAGSQMVCFNPSDAELVRRSWAAIGRLVNAVPVFSLAYGRGYERLLGVAETLNQLLRDHRRAP